MSLRTCKRCGWVHVACTRAFAEKSIADFNDYFDKADEETRDLYGGKHSTMADYDRCVNCGASYKEFRPARPNDCPDGCTMGPVLEDPDTDTAEEVKNAP